MKLTDVVDIVRTKACAVKPEKDSPETKTVNLRISFAGLTFADVLELAIRTIVISWQTGARKRFDALVDGSTVDIQAKSPGVRPAPDPVLTIVQLAKNAGMSVEEYIKAEMAKRNPPQVEKLT